MKRIVTLLLALMLVLASIPAALADTAAPLVIEFWHTRGSGANYEVTKASVDEFNATIGKEKGIEVVEIYSGSYADIVTKLQLAAQTDSKPAVAVCRRLHQHAAGRPDHRRYGALRRRDRL